MLYNEKDNNLHYYFSTYENFSKLEKEKEEALEFFNKFYSKILNYYLTNKEEILNKASCKNSNYLSITEQFMKYFHLPYSTTLCSITRTILYQTNN